MKEKLKKRIELIADYRYGGRGDDRRLDGRN